MPHYVIESKMPGVGKLSAQELRAASQHSSNLLAELGPQIQWVQSFVTDDKIYAIYIAPDEKRVLEYARQAGLSADHVSEVRAVIDATTGEG
jgi:hypothetical protein